MKIQTLSLLSLCTSSALAQRNNDATLTLNKPQAQAVVPSPGIPNTPAVSQVQPVVSASNTSKTPAYVPGEAVAPVQAVAPAPNTLKVPAYSQAQASANSSPMAPSVANSLAMFGCPGPYNGPYVDSYHYEWTKEPVKNPICPLRQTNPLHPEKQLLATWWRATCNTPCNSQNGTAAGDLLFMNYNLTLLGDLRAGVIDSTYDKEHPNGDPFNFTLGAKPRLQVVPGFDRALYGMCKGEKRQIKLTAAGAYGEKGAPPVIPVCAELYFSVELVDFRKSNSSSMAGNYSMPARNATTTTPRTPRRFR